MPPTTTPTQPPTAPDRRDQRLPANAGTFGMALFLIALGMLFAASMVGFLVIRFINLQPTLDPLTGEVVPSNAPPLGSVPLPHALWLSTFIIMFSSVTIHAAVEAVRRERQLMFRRWLIFTNVLAAMFLLIQAPSLATLLAEHFGAQDLEQGQGKTGVFGLIFTLIVIHALHLVGGIAPLIRITLQAHAGRYDHEYHRPVRYVAMYWHFLDAVWLIMFATLLIAS